MFGSANKPSIVPVRYDLLTHSIIAREALHLCALAAEWQFSKIDEYTIGTKLGGELKQIGVNVLFNEGDLALCLDEFVAKRLADPMLELGKILKSDGAFWTFSLPLPKDCQSFIKTYGGLSMRMILIETELAPQRAWLTRFEILYLTKIEKEGNGG